MIHVLLTVMYLAVILWIIGRSRFFRIKGVNPRVIQGVMLVKVLAGVGLWAIYTYHYTYRDTSDAFRYFDDARVVFKMLGDNPGMFFRFLFGIGLDSPDCQPFFDQMRGWTSSYSYGILNDNPTIIRINVLINFLSFGYYHVHTVVLSFMSLIGGVAMVKGFMRMTRIPSFILITGCLMLPSLLLWTSGVLKEAPLMLGLGLLSWKAIQWYKNGRWRDLVMALLLVVLMFFIKGYVILLFLPAVSFLLFARFTPRRTILTSGLIHVFILVFAVAGLYSAGDVGYVLQKKQTDFVNVGVEHNAGSLIEPLDISSVGAQISSVPKAWYRTYLRPDLRDTDSIFHIGLGIEAWALVVLGILGLFFRRRALFNREKVTLLFCWSFVLSLGLVIGVCVPILGAIVRYKVPALPFLVVAMFSVIDFDLLKSKAKAMKAST